MANLRFPFRPVSDQFYINYNHPVRIFPFYKRGINEDDEMLVESFIVSRVIEITCNLYIMIIILFAFLSTYYNARCST